MTAVENMMNHSFNHHANQYEKTKVSRSDNGLYLSLDLTLPDFLKVDKNGSKERAESKKNEISSPNTKRSSDIQNGSLPSLPEGEVMQSPASSQHSASILHESIDSAFSRNSSVESLAVSEGSSLPDALWESKSPLSSRDFSSLEDGVFQTEERSIKSVSPVDFVFWEESQMSHKPLKKTYSLPTSPNSKEVPKKERSSSGFEENLPVAFVFNADEANASTNIKPRRASPQRVSAKPAHSKTLSKIKMSFNIKLKGAKTVNIRKDLQKVTSEGELLCIDKQRVVNCWCAVEEYSLYVFEGNDPLSKLIKLFDLTDCSVSKPLQVDVEDAIPLGNYLEVIRSDGSKIVLASREPEVIETWTKLLFQTAKSAKVGYPRKQNIFFASLRALSPNTHSDKSEKNRQSVKATISAPMSAPASIPMSKSSFADMYGWNEKQSVERTKRAKDAATESPISFNNSLYSSGTDSRISSKANSSPSSPSTLPLRPKKSPEVRTGSLRKTLNILPHFSDFTPRLRKKHRSLSSTLSLPLDQNLKSGQLLVKRNSSWKRCYAVVTQDQLKIYKQKEDMKPITEIPLPNYTVEVPQPLSPPVGQTRFKFILVSKTQEPIHFLADTELDGHLWVKKLSETCVSAPSNDLYSMFDKRNRMSAPTILEKDLSEAITQDSDLSHQSDASNSESSAEEPFLKQKRALIQSRYQRANEVEEMNAVKRTTILNQRRMSAQTKLDALDRKLLEQRAQKGKKKKDKKKKDTLSAEEEQKLKELLEQLKERLNAINKNLDTSALVTEQKRLALKKKEVLELEILEHEKELVKYRRDAKAALKAMMENNMQVKSPTKDCQVILEEREPFVMHSPTSSFSEDTQSRNHAAPRFSHTSSSSSMSSLSSVGISDRDSPRNLTSGHRKLPKTPNLRKAKSFDSFAPSSPVLKYVDESVSKDETDFTEAMLPYDSSQSQVSLGEGFRNELLSSSSPNTNSERGGVPMLYEDERVFPSTEAEIKEDDVGPNVSAKIRTEVPADVLRDIDDFEQMARRALERAGWLV